MSFDVKAMRGTAMYTLIYHLITLSSILSFVVILIISGIFT